MTLLPVVERELRVAARRNKTYWLRWAAAGTALFVCLWSSLFVAGAQPAVTAGKTLFLNLSILGFAYCLLIGPFITADCVSEEKREGTLGLLFLTELNSLDVVCGKWLATSLAGFYGLLAILPALGLPLLMGGVTPGEYGRTALAIMNAILFSLSAAMCVSTFSREQPKAILASAVLILGLAGLVPGLAVVIESGLFTKPVNQFPVPALASPAFTGYLALDAQYRPAPHRYWMSLGAVHGLFWLFLLVTAAHLPRVWRESPADKPVARRWLWRLGYTGGWRRVFRRRLETNPVFAVAARQRWPHLVFWGLVALVTINVYWLTYGYRKNVSTLQFHQYFSHALVFLNRIWISVMACRFFLEARRTGALELLLTSPLPVRTVLRGNGRALWFLFALPVAAIAALHVFYVMESTRLMGPMGAGRGVMVQSYEAAAASSLVRFLTDVLALGYVGAWMSVSSRRPGFAVLKTFTLVILIPWTVGYVLQTNAYLLSFKVAAFLNAQAWTRWLGGSVSQWLYPLGNAGVIVLKNLLFVAWARHCLHRHLRAAAGQTHRLDRRSSGWRRWFLGRSGGASSGSLTAARAPAGRA
jgi:ABC-type transport system involved in multi-copper enzyme maturation permease subunit